MNDANSDRTNPENNLNEGDETIGSPEIEKKVSLEEYQPKGTLALALIYFVIIVLMWIFMYFGEFANHGPSILN
ncbi:MAG: hypothetical protein PVH63_01795 [Balneolaceae bacterium]|jgi:hypothetical protein